MAILAQYNPEWKKLYKAQSKRIKKTLGSKCTGTYHIGATSINGMLARPIIDILVILSDERVTAKLFDIGYVTGDDGSYILHADGVSYTVRTAMRKDYQSVAPYLAIPYYLTEDKAAAEAFGQKKQAIAQQYENDLQAYRAAYKQLLDEIQPLALEKKTKADKAGSYMAIGMCLGCSIGLCLGSALGNMGVGMCLGTGIGMCLGVALGQSQE